MKTHLLAILIGIMSQALPNVVASRLLNKKLKLYQAF